MISPHWTGDLRPLNGSLLAVSPRALNNMKKNISAKGGSLLGEPSHNGFYNSM